MLNKSSNKNRIVYLMDKTSAFLYEGFYVAYGMLVRILLPLSMLLVLSFYVFLYTRIVKRYINVMEKLFSF